jgi:hypothetical protein
LVTISAGGRPTPLRVAYSVEDISAMLVYL